MMHKKDRFVPSEISAAPLSLIAYISSASIQSPEATFHSSSSDLQLRTSIAFGFCVVFVFIGNWRSRFPPMYPHSALWPEYLGPRPDGIRYAQGESMSVPAGAPPFPCSDDTGPYAFRSGNPCGENFSFGDVDSQFYYYGHLPCNGDQSTDPWLLNLMEDLRELYVRRRRTFQELFPRLHDEIDRKLEEALRSKRTRDVRAFQRSLSVGSPRLPGRDRGVGDEPALRLDRFKVRTFDLEDDVAESGGQGGKGGGGGGRNGGE